MNVRLRVESGFTLVEVLIAVSLVGILVMIALFSANVPQEIAKKTVCKANLRTIRSALEAYHSVNEESTYPSALSVLVPDYIKSGSSLLCPKNNASYTYEPGTGEVKCTYPLHVNF